MLPVTSKFLQAIRESHRVFTTTTIVLPDGTTVSDYPIADGSVTVDATQPVRRVFTCAADPADDLWRTVILSGATLRPQLGVRYVDGTTEAVPLGVFEVRGAVLDEAQIEPTALTAPDRYRRVQRARFEQPTPSTVGLSIAAQWAKLVRDPQTAATTFVDLSGSTRGCPKAVWARDRDTAAAGLAASLGCEGFFDAAGNPVLRPIPVIGTPVWTVDAGQDGVLLTAQTTRTDDLSYSVVVAVGTRTDGTALFPPQVAADTDPTSPTYVGGPFGRVARYYSSPLLTTAAQASAAARSLLTKVRGQRSTLQLTAIPNAALDAGDTIRVILPGGDTQDLVVVDGITLGLSDSASMTLQVRQAVPLPDEPS